MTLSVGTLGWTGFCVNMSASFSVQASGKGLYSLVARAVALDCGSPKPLGIFNVLVNLQFRAM